MSKSLDRLPSSPLVAQGKDRWTVLRMIEWSGEYLEGKGIVRGRLDAEHLLADVLGLGRLELYLQFDRPLVAAELDQYRPLLKRRATREPLQYILGRAAFRELDLEVDGRVLIPRPETEILLDEVLEWAGAHAGAQARGLDVGTGSGAIALSLVLEGPFELVVATDSSEGALEVARCNAEAAGLGEKVEFRLGSYFEPVSEAEVFEMLDLLDELDEGERSKLRASFPDLISESSRQNVAAMRWANAIDKLKPKGKAIVGDTLKGILTGRLIELIFG